jgi:hypothetical protein
MDDRLEFKRVKHPLQKIVGSTIQIGRKRYQVIFCRGLVVDGRDQAGLCSPRHKAIFINVDHGEVLETFLHEMFHAECSENGVRQAPSWNMDIEEIMVETLSQGLSHSFDIVKKKTKIK